MHQDHDDEAQNQAYGAKEIAVTAGFINSCRRADGSRMSLYEILECLPGATRAEIRRSYKRLALSYHPDKSGEETMFLLLHGAYEILSNQQSRARYDHLRLGTREKFEEFCQKNVESEYVEDEDIEEIDPNYFRERQPDYGTHGDASTNDEEVIFMGRGSAEKKSDCSVAEDLTSDLLDEETKIEEIIIVDDDKDPEEERGQEGALAEDSNVGDAVHSELPTDRPVIENQSTSSPDRDRRDSGFLGKEHFPDPVDLIQDGEIKTRESKESSDGPLETELINEETRRTTRSQSRKNRVKETKDVSTDQYDYRETADEDEEIMEVEGQENHPRKERERNRKDLRTPREEKKHEFKKSTKLPSKESDYDFEEARKGKGKGRKAAESKNSNDQEKKDSPSGNDEPPKPLRQTLRFSLEQIYEGLPSYLFQYSYQKTECVNGECLTVPCPDEIKLEIPKGCAERHEIIIPGKGNMTANTRGPLIVIVRSSKHEVFTRYGKDLLINVTFRLKDLEKTHVLRIKTLTGSTLEIHCDRHQIHSQTGCKSICNMGLPAPRPNQDPGKLLVQYRVVSD